MPEPEVCMTTSPFLCVNYPCDEALTWSRDQLLQTGLRLVQTFDLHAARLASHDCSCPNHGTEACDCQMVVLLVYGEKEEPSTLILHGNNGQTWLSISDDPRLRADTNLYTEIKQALEKIPDVISQAK